MNATPPEANTEYSRTPTAYRWALAGALLAAALLVAAEFAPLYTVRLDTTKVAVQSLTAGAHHAYALAPLAALAVALALAAYRGASTPALVALGALGLATLAIALVGDLPDAHARGITRGFELAQASPDLGFYLETLGGALLVLCGLGVLAAGAPARLRIPAWGAGLDPDTANSPKR